MQNRQIPEDDLKKIFTHCDAWYKDFFQILIDTGFRLDDVLSIRRYEAKSALDCGVLALTEAKTGKGRRVELSADASRALAKHLKECNKQHPFAYVYQSSRKVKKMKKHRCTPFRHFAEAVKRAGLEGKGYTVHSLRKVYARRLYAKTSSAIAVQKDLNHDKLNTTLLYICDVVL